MIVSPANVGANDFMPDARAQAPAMRYSTSSGLLPDIFPSFDGILTLTFSGIVEYSIHIKYSPTVFIKELQ